MALDHLTKRYRLDPGKKVALDEIPTDDKAGWSKDDARPATAKLWKRLLERQEVLAATDTHALLIVLQAMDAGGKDSTIRHLSRGLSVGEAEVAAFKAPTDVERAHDFLWRVHRRVPPLGKIGIFNRSHYEDVLVVRVKELVPKAVWKARYEQINAFEALLASANVHIVKIFLHISKAYQTKRLKRRLDLPEKHWKLTADDLRERKRWDEYQRAYADALERCSTEAAPWYVVPAEHRWFRDLLVARIVVERLEALGLEYPPPTIDPKDVVLE
ncbi:MAG TPA: polyphosphate kinase 2 family protein [Phycisphaerae bacterium]|nr:polyphosphate kinase 2 family protein [Phycisphaerae bacterium]